jgi:hypothetical protein
MNTQRKAADMPASPARMYDYFREKAELAITYAKDGAYHTAADRFEELAREARAHSDKLKAIGL